VHDFFWWAIACARIFLVKHKTWYSVGKQDLIGFFPRALLARFSPAAFCCAGIFFGNHPSHTAKKIMMLT